MAQRITQTETAAEPLAPGRPRDATIDNRVLASTRELLARDGFDATTIQAVARSAEVATTAIYRRWPSRIALIAAAMTPGLDEVGIAPTGDLAADLRNFVLAFLEVLSSPAARVGVPGLWANRQATGDDSLCLNEQVADGLRPAFRAAMDVAGPGQVDAAVDFDDLLDLLIGSALYHSFVQPDTGRPTEPERIVQLLVRAASPYASQPLTPRGQSTSLR